MTHNPSPVVLVHGLFGWGSDELLGLPYWGVAQQLPSSLERFVASVGPVSSSHDRACELAFQIKGGRVDYGEHHSRAAGHEQFGREYSRPFHPQWSANDPVHLVGHSMGAPTIWMLQHLLAIDHFGWGSTADWVKSITSISGVLNGSTATYFFGADERTGLLQPASIGSFLALALEIHVRLAGDLFERLYDFQLDHWSIAPGQRLDHMMTLLERSPIFRGKDNAAYSLTVQALHEQNELCVTNPGTYYFSHATEQSREGFLSRHHYPEVRMNPVLFPTSIYMGRATYSQPLYPQFRADEWWHNDGLVPVYSQLLPRSAGNHPDGGPIVPSSETQPGRWYHEVLASTDHTDIVLLPEAHQIGAQKRFYKDLFDRLAAL